MNIEEYDEGPPNKNEHRHIFSVTGSRNITFENLILETDKTLKQLSDFLNTPLKKEIKNPKFINNSSFQDVNKLFDARSCFRWKNFVKSNDSIQFDVRGSKFRGRVIITYDKRNDTYVVELGKVRNMDWKQKYMMKNVFAGDLVNILDQQVG